MVDEAMTGDDDPCVPTDLLELFVALEDEGKTPEDLQAYVDGVSS